MVLVILECLSWLNLFLFFIEVWSFSLWICIKLKGFGWRNVKNWLSRSVQLIPVSYSNTICSLDCSDFTYLHILFEFQNISFKCQVQCLCQSLRLGLGGLVVIVIRLQINKTCMYVCMLSNFPLFVQMKV